MFPAPANACREVVGVDDFYTTPPYSLKRTCNSFQVPGLVRRYSVEQASYRGGNIVVVGHRKVPLSDAFQSGAYWSRIWADPRADRPVFCFS
jgi:hypothetical protein